MNGAWQAVRMAVLVAALTVVATAEGKKAEFDYNPPEVGNGMFTDDLNMLDRERGEFASNLAAHAANQVAEARASKASLDAARRLIGLARHLSPRNREALVINHQLKKGIIPEKTEGVYSPGVFARLLLTRAQLLDRDGGFQDKLLARAFIELATEMDSRNEDAVYAFELQRLDHGDFDWSVVTDYKEPVKKAPAPAPVDDPMPEAKPDAAPEKKPEPKAADRSGAPRRGPTGGRP
jgi:hypothetical protein